MIPKTKIPITKKPRLIEVRNTLIFHLREQGYLFEEISQIFRLRTGSIHRILSNPLKPKEQTLPESTETSKKGVRSDLK